jgi:anaerobic magnesium-protoporphyrin IX monomethyl ester cyclase
MMRVLFVRPQIGRRMLALSLPPLGIMYLASYLRSAFKGDLEVRVVDLTIERQPRRRTWEALDGFQPDLVGFSAMTPEDRDLTFYARLLRQKYPGALLMAGGPHANAAPEHVLRESKVDFVALGEGEQTVLRAVERLRDGDPVQDLPGLAYRKDGETVFNPAVDQIENLDSIPFPAWDLVPLLHYCSWRVVNPSMSRHYKRFTTLFTSRSCPFGCAYCHNIFGKRYRMRSPENVFAEMEALERRYGIQEFHISDDCFNLRPKRVLALCDLIIENKKKYRLAFVSGLRGDILTTAVVDRLREAGTYQISMGIETGSTRLQKLIGRNGDLATLLSIIDYTRRSGIITHGFFMFGFPTETREEMEETVQTALKANLVTAAFHTVAPYPGTGLFKFVEQKYGKDRVDLREMFFKSSTYNLSEVPTEEVHRIIKAVFKAFYWNRSRLYDIWRLAPRKVDVLMSAVFHLFLDPRLLRLRERLTGRRSY